ncbi:MAG TPA: B-box zinc finger protein, partial [Phototrophicaceae bacterium]|nr:B-box zinc finger protein [Phototrophicaceae bacterium]
MAETTPIVDETTYCEVHTNKETSLRCNKCERFMCVDCAVLTPVGYRCRECVRQHENKFYSANQADYAIVLAVSAVLSGIGGAIISVIGFLFLVIFIAIPVGGGISEAALRLTGRRRGRYSGHISAAGVVVGGLIGGFIQNYLAYANELAQRFPRRVVPPPPLEAVLTATISDISLLLFSGIVPFE